MNTQKSIYQNPISSAVTFNALISKAVTVKVFMSVALMFLTQHAYTNTLVKEISSGQIKGKESAYETQTWRGIPYAKAPVGHLRWKAPQPISPWLGVKDTTKTAAMCPQMGGPLTTLNVLKWNKLVGSEDCLFLNVTAPKDIDDKKLLPVMFWIHGGGNSIGHGGNRAYTGEELAKQGQVIVVSINYRLGPLGWFFHPSLETRTQEEAVTAANYALGNYGTLDIIEALKWVQDNIAHFGGDAENVTVFGESAGGANTFSMLLSPLAKGLFHKAIVESGGIFPLTLDYASQLTDQDEHINPEKEKQVLRKLAHEQSSNEILIKLLQKKRLVKNRAEGISFIQQNEAKVLEEILRETSVEDLLQSYPIRAAGMLDIPLMFRDGWVLPNMDPAKAFSDVSTYNAMPIILGTNRDENKTFMALDRRFVDWRFQMHDKAKYQRAANYQALAWKVRGVDEYAGIISEAQQGNVYAYRFDWDELPDILDVELSELIGAGHGLEIPFVFGSFRSDFSLDFLFGNDGKERRELLSKSMVSYWSQFAYSGNPNRGRDQNEIEWKPWLNKIGEDKFIVLDAGEGGISMSDQAISYGLLKQQLANDEGITENLERCSLYKNLFIRRDRVNFNQKEFDEFGEAGCKGLDFEALSL